VSTELVVLAVFMFLGTYPSRALGLLWPGIDRLPRIALDYLQLVGPAVLAALAAVNTMVDDASGTPRILVGVEWLAVLACLAITARFKNLLAGLVVAAAIMAVSRAAGIAPLILGA
jgi:branched-subunit amino acid transport protein